MDTPDYVSLFQKVSLYQKVKGVIPKGERCQKVSLHQKVVFMPKKWGHYTKRCSAPFITKVIVPLYQVVYQSTVLIVKFAYSDIADQSI